MARGSTGPTAWLRRYFQLVLLVTRLASQVCRVMLLRFHPRPRSGMVSLTSRSRGTAIVPMSVPLTQALGANIFSPFSLPLSLQRDFLFVGYRFPRHL